jgi:hypothetical protein
MKIPRYGLALVKHIKIPVSTMEFYTPLGSLDVTSISFHDEVQQSLTAIYIDTLKYDTPQSLKNVVSHFKSQCSNLKEIKVGSYDSKHINNKLFDVLFDKELGVRLPNI